MKATFISRFIALIIDTLIITVILSIIGTFIPVSDKSNELKKENNTIMEKLKDGDISFYKYNEESGHITYKQTKETYIPSLISLAVYIGYFMFYQFYNGGKTVGKKLMKIKVVGKNKVLEMKDIVVRELFVNMIFTSILELILILFLSWKPYWITSSILEYTLLIAIIVSGFMILFRKDKLALHDIFTKTEVVKDDE